MKLRWGVIGCGGIADRRTIPGMMLAENSQLTVVMDANFAVAKNVAEKYGARAVETIDELLADSEVDAVYIASPVFCHKEQCFAAAKAKKHILLEKPMGLTCAESQEIADFCEKAGVKLGVGFMMRFHSYHQKIRELIGEGKLGEIVSARAQLTCWYPEIENCWRQNKALSGGGAMMDMGIHCIDLIRYITGLEPVEAAAMCGNQIFRYSADDAGAAIYRMNNGATCIVDANFNIPDAAAICKLEFYGTKGSVCAEGTISQVEGGSIRVLCTDDVGEYDAAQTRGEIKPLELEVDFGNMYTKEVEAFADAVLNGGEVPVTAADAIRSQRAIEAAYNGSDTGKTVSL